MRDPDRAFRLVDVLAAGTGGPIDIDAQIAFVDLDINFLGFRQNRDCDCGGVDAPLIFGRRNTLHAMHA